jgi:hypothetical protein
MSNEILQQIGVAGSPIGVPISFSSAGDVAFSAAGVGFQTGRKSALWDRGLSPQPGMYSWRAKTKLQTTGGLGLSIDFYIATSDGTIVDGGVVPGDAAFLAENSLPNLRYIDSLIIDTTSGASIQSSGSFWMPSRYGVLVMWDNTAAETLSATAADHDFIVTPIWDQVQP